MDLHDPGTLRDQWRDDRLLERAGGGDHITRLDRAVRCLDAKAGAAFVLAYRPDLDAATDRRLAAFGKGLEGICNRVLGHEGFPVVAGEFEAGIAIMPGGTIGDEAIPTLGPPALGDAAAL